MDTLSERPERQKPGLDRRAFLRATAAAGAGWLTCGNLLAAAENAGPSAGASNPLAVANRIPRYRIAVCDWMILKRQKLGSLALAKEIGAGGVEVDMGPLGDRDTFENQLARPEVRQAFLARAAELQIEICSLAMSGFYAQSFAERPTFARMVEDCIETMKAMKVRTAFLPLGVQGDLAKRPELWKPIVQRLKAIAPAAEKAGVTIGVETSLPAREEARLLDETGSRAVRSYFNFANALQAGRDVNQELRQLGRERIGQIHCTDEDGVWLQDNSRLDLVQTKRTLDEMGWTGWLVVERSRSAKDPRNVKWNFSANVAYLKKIFQPG
jgi:sugar phosphate isomerase/epimerase